MNLLLGLILTGAVGLIIAFSLINVATAATVIGLAAMGGLLFFGGMSGLTIYRCKNPANESADPQASKNCI